MMDSKPRLSTASSTASDSDRPRRAAKKKRPSARARKSSARRVVAPRPIAPVEDASRDRELAQTILTELYRGAERAPRDVGALAKRLGARPTQIARVLLRLEERGLLVPERVRLTMRGLAIAASLAASARFAVQVA